MNEILKLIETADPNDTAKMDEIDTKVWLWLYLKKGMAAAIPQHPKYTRSRDALKAIRPEGYQFDIEGIQHKYEATISKSPMPSPEYVFFSGELPTEELAELSAIIKAIEFERQANKGG